MNLDCPAKCRDRRVRVPHEFFRVNELFGQRVYVVSELTGSPPLERALEDSINVGNLSKELELLHDQVSVAEVVENPEGLSEAGEVRIVPENP